MAFNKSGVVNMDSISANTWSGSTTLFLFTFIIVIQLRKLETFFLQISGLRDSFGVNKTKILAKLFCTWTSHKPP